MHRVVETHLESYLEGTLRVIDRREVEKHLDGCPACRGEVAELRQAHEWMQLLAAAEPLAPAPGFYNRVRLRIEAANALRAWPFWQLLPAFGRQLAYATMVLVLLAGAYVFTFQRTEQRAASNAIVDTLLRGDAPTLSADSHANRERAMQSIVTPVSAVEGD
jgi:anti-sigma factor RsiW